MQFSKMWRPSLMGALVIIFSLQSSQVFAQQVDLETPNSGELGFSDSCDLLVSEEEAYGSVRLIPSVQNETPTNVVITLQFDGQTPCEIEKTIPAAFHFPKGAFMIKAVDKTAKKSFRMALTKQGEPKGGTGKTDKGCVQLLEHGGFMIGCDRSEL